MTYDEMNSFILNYLKNDITGRAIMLTGEWGSGKSYYVKNTLKPFLEDKENGKHKCVIVSLYGLSDTSEISKAIYMELRTINKSPSSEAGNTAKVVGKIVGKTIFNGLVSKIGFDIGSIEDKEFQEIYESVDLAGKLIILEDIERTQIDIIELLGYINNMCENDGVKVLLVTNESELLTTYEEKDNQGKATKYYTDDALAYKRAKEKTIGDTIYYICDYENTIQQIIGSFGVFLQKYRTPECAEDIRDIFFLMTSHNLRAFIYCCQKIKEIIMFIEDNHISVKDEIQKIIFYGSVAFTQRQSKGADLQFERDAYLSAKLGLNDQYPLFKFCYDYIVYQVLSKDDIKKSIAYYTDYRKNGKWNSGRDSDLKIIKEFGIKTDKEVIEAIQNLPQKLNAGDIPYYDYGVLMNYLVAIKYEAGIDFNITAIENSIIGYLKNAPNEINIESLFNSGYELHKEEAINAFDYIKQRMKDALGNIDVLDFPYDPEKIIEYYDKNIRKLQENIHSKGFTHNLDINHLVDMLKKCSSAQISKIRSLFLDLYRDQHYSQILEDDIFALNELSDKISALQQYDQYDNIQKMQMHWLNKNINDIILSFDIQRTQGR